MPAGEKSRIGLMVSKLGNRRLLRDFLEQQGHLCLEIHPAGEFSHWDELQLLLIDEARARRASRQLKQLKERANLVPILLLLGNHSPAGTGWSRQGLIDDVIRLPIAKIDLASRLHLALRLSVQSRVANLKLERLVKDASWGVVVLEPENLRIQVANQAFASMHGYRPEELTGMPLAELQSQPQKLEQGAFECWHRHRNGSRLPLEMELTYYPEESGPGYFGAFARDIQARKEIEAELLRQHRELEEARRLADKANLAKSDFLANMSHEIRTPLNGMLATLEMLLTTQLTERQRELSQLARHSSETLLGLVSEVLDFSKIEAGQMQLESVPVELAELLADVVKPFGLLAEAKNLSLRCSWDSRLHQTVSADPLRLRQILQNLLSNAVKFTHRGEIRVKAWSEAEWTCLEVQDQGIGMAPEQQQTIFEPFTQADTSTTRRFGGTGLGLAICKRLVGLMEGRLELESQPGKGSCFRCWLPLPPTTSLGPPESCPPQAGPETTTSLEILVCEDNPLNQRIMVLLLQQLGHRVSLANDGVDGLAAWQSGRFDLILMDLQMPNLGGMEAAREIRRRGGKLPIVALTARTVNGDREACLAAGMDDYLTKPVRADELREVLARLGTPWVPQGDSAENG